ncbi:MAG: hypothetical protein ACJ735_03730 [Actinomycetes bacterium]
MAELATLPDDASAVDPALDRLIQSLVATIPAVDYASATARRDGRHSTVAFSSDLAVAVDEGQYAAEAGPCIDAADGTVRSVEDITTVIEWPQFRDAAMKMGLGSSLSIPLFTASGDPSIALNLYAREPMALSALAGAIVAEFYREAAPTQSTPDESLDEGSRDLVCGVLRALQVRDEIQRGIGIVMGRDQINAAAGYARLRVEAADADTSILTHVNLLSARHAGTDSH